MLPLTECHLLDSGIEAVRATVEGWLRDNDLPGWDPRTGEGFARHLLVRSAQDGQELLVSLVTAARSCPTAKVWSIASGRAPAADGGRARRQHRAGRTQCRPPFYDALGRPYLLEKVAGLTLKVSLDAFFQTNTLMAERLYGLVADEVTARRWPGGCQAIRARHLGPVLGSGVHRSDPGRPGGGGCLGIEAVPDAVEDARENARLNHIQNAAFLEGDVAKVLREVAGRTRTLAPSLERPDIVVVDPPRAGLSNKAMARIGEVGAPVIVYVSCNPATLGPNALPIPAVRLPARARDAGRHVPPHPARGVRCALARDADWEPAPRLRPRASTVARP